MTSPAVAKEDRAILQSLADSGPRQALPGAVRGRLFLYNLITQTPLGWVITDEGREALRKPAPEEPEPAPPIREPAVRSNPPRRGSPKVRQSPF